MITTAGTTINTNVDTATYTDLQSCLWTITAPDGLYPTISFSSFATEHGYDYFSVYDGSSTDSPQLFSQSGFAHFFPTVTGSQSTMTVTFTSDFIIVDAGVVAVVGFSEEAGSGTIPWIEPTEATTELPTVMLLLCSVAGFLNIRPSSPPARVRVTAARVN